VPIAFRWAVFLFKFVCCSGHVCFLPAWGSKLTNPFTLTHFHNVKYRNLPCALIMLERVYRLR
jgi:hypothetical protein